MTDYSEWERESLITRIRELEAKLETSRNDGSSHAESSVENAERLRAILDTAVEGIITIDEHGIVESVNPAAEKVFGYTAAEMVGRNVCMLMPSPHREKHDAYMETYRRTGQARIIGRGREVVGRKKDGSVFPMDLSVAEVKLKGGRLFTGVVRDVTERKRAEDQLSAMTRALAEKNKELETIVYVASHDLRSPLVNIQGFSREVEQACNRIGELISNEAKAHRELNQVLTQEIPEAIGFILASVNKIDTLLAGLLRFSRLGRAALKLEWIDMNLLLNKVTRSMEFQIKEAGGSVHLGELPACVGDATQLTQVFSNLLDNAVKFRDLNRPLRITVSGRVENGWVVYAVRDNGMGIAPEHLQKVFEIFYRLNPSATEGEGLGLTIAQRSLERQNGRITVESESGAGTTFFVFLPHTSK